MSRVVSGMEVERLPFHKDPAPWVHLELDYVAQLLYFGIKIVDYTDDSSLYHRERARPSYFDIANICSCLENMIAKGDIYFGKKVTWYSLVM